MKLKEVTEQIFQGLKFYDKDILNHKQITDSSILLLFPEEIENGDVFINDQSKFIKEQTYQKIYGNKPIKGILLSYNDLIYFPEEKLSFHYKNDFKYKIIPSENIIVIRPLGYLSSFISNTSGLKYLEEELNKVFRSEYSNKIELIEKIYIPEISSNTDEILSNRVRPDKKQVDLSKMNIKQGLMTLDKVLKRIEHKEIDINVDRYFQRNSGLWDIDTKSRFIEALIVNQPVPAFYFDSTNKDEWKIIDGLQRLTTVNQFVNEKSFKLTDLYYLPNEYLDKSFDDLPRTAQRNIEEYEIMAYQIEAPTPKEIIIKIFKSINTSALNLTHQEIRHALNQGNASKWVKELAEIPIFEKVISVKSDRMYDRELALRYLAFRITPYEDCPNNIQDFLDESMTKLLLDVAEDDFKRYKVDFGESLFAIDRIFENTAYKKNIFGIDNEYFVNHLFETFTVVFSKLSQKQREKLIDKKLTIRHKIKELKNNTKFVKSIDSDGAYTKESLKTRFETLTNFFNELSK